MHVERERIAVKKEKEPEGNNRQVSFAIAGRANRDRTEEATDTLNYERTQPQRNK